MTICKIEKEFHFANGLIAKYTIERLGQRPPYESDYVESQLTIYLPVKNIGDSRLNPELVFGERKRVLGESLSQSWGYYPGPESEWRCSCEHITAETYSQGFADLEKIAEDQLKQLNDAIKGRMEALRKAEE